MRVRLNFVRRTGVALLSIVALTAALTWWLSRVEVEPPPPEPVLTPLAVAIPAASSQTEKTVAKEERIVVHERRGRVVDAEGHPIEGALVQPYVQLASGRRDLDRVISDPEGNFRLTVEDSARVEVSHQCCRSADVSVGRADVELLVTLEPSDLEQVSFAGVVVDEDNHPIEGASVEGIASVGDEVALAIVTKTDVRGAFSVKVPADSKITVRSKRGAKKSGELTLEPSTSARIVLLDHAGSISGRVRDEAGLPVTEFQLHLQSDMTDLRIEVMSTEGEFSISGLPKLESATLMLVAPGFLDPGPRSVTLARDEHVTGIDFVLQRGLSIRGVVIDRETKHPLDGANVRLIGVFKPGPNGRTRTDSLGRFVLSGVTGSRVEVLINRSGYVGRREVFETANQAEVHIGLTSESSPNAAEEYVGVGMQFGNGKMPNPGSGYLVSSLHPQGGAVIAGVQLGDEILAADGVQASSVPIREFLRQIKGAEGSVVRLTLRRDGQSFELHVARRELTAW